MRNRSPRSDRLLHRPAPAGAVLCRCVSPRPAFAITPARMCSEAVQGRLLTEPRACFTRRSEEHTSELQSLMRISYAVFCLKKKKKTRQTTHKEHNYKII